MKATDFNTGWTCRHLGTPAPGTPVTLPHDAMLAEERTQTAAGGTNTGWFTGYDYLYEKHFTPDAAQAAQCLVLEFEGVYHNAEVHLNGEKIAACPYGYSGFYADMTNRIKCCEDNVLEIIARNADQPNSRWYSGAGIYRPVTLWTAPARHILPDGVQVRTLGLSPAEVEVTVQTSDAGAVSIAILDGGRVVATAQAQSDGKAVARVTVPNAKLWSPESPALYRCRAVFGDDCAETTFGVRTLSWGDDGLLLNGKRILLLGACVHHDHGVLGACCYPEAEERKVRLLQKVGYNAVRCAHNPCSKAFLDACDRLGMLVMDEYADMWYIHKTQYDYAGYLPEQWPQDLAALVRKDYSHPSVIMYSIGNEVAETAQPRGIELTKQMTEALHHLDGTRPVTCGVNIFFNFLSSMGFGVYSDSKAEKEAKAAAKRAAAGKAAPKKKAVGSEFFNNLAGLLGADFMKWGASLPPCDWKTKDAFASMDAAGYNYGINRYELDLKKYPHRLIVGSETFCSDAYRFYELAKREPRLLGDFVWAGMDYLGEVGIGAWEYPDYVPDFSHGPGWIAAGAGRIDLTGQTQGEALYTRVALDLEKGPLLAVWPVNHTKEKHSPSAWRMSHAIPSWSWHGCDGEPAMVEIYARAARVELKLNGQTVGKAAPKNDCVVRIPCTYHDGTLEAVSYDAAGNELGRTALRTADAATELRAVPEAETVRPGGLAFIRLQYTDANGTVKPLERGTVTVTVHGGTLLGLGSACTYSERGYLTDTTDTYFGEALAVIRADADVDTVELTAAGGTHIGTCRIACKE